MTLAERKQLVEEALELAKDADYSLFEAHGHWQPGPSYNMPKAYEFEKRAAEAARRAAILLEKVGRE